MSVGTFRLQNIRRIYMIFSILFNDALAVIHIIKRRMKAWWVIDELERMWKEAVVA
jgi:hypothetical protein